MAGLPRVPVTSLTLERYGEVFEALVARSHEYDALQEQLAKIASEFPAEFSVLDVGAGPGQVLSDWVDRSGRRPSSYVGIEPLRRHAEPLRAAIASLGIEGHVIEVPFQPDLDVDGPFDIVLFSHSAYFLAEPAPSLRRALALTKPGGTVVVFMAGPVGMYAMKTLFETSLDRDRPALVEPGCSHHFVRQLRAGGLVPTVSYLPSWFDLTGLFDPSSEAERNEFFSFCLQVEFSRVPEPFRTDVIEYLRMACVERDGRLCWWQPTAMIRLDADRR